MHTRDETVEYLRERYPDGRGRHYNDVGAILFYGGVYSNFVGGPHRIKNPWTGEFERYWTVEGWFAANKATTPEIHAFIQAIENPLFAKQAGRKVKMTLEQVAAWDERKYEVMLEGLRAKFAIGTQESLELLGTGQRYIAEDSPTDAVWGLWNSLAHDWTGLNLLGEAIMQVRTELVKELHGT